jgi:hypothetical protein
LAVAWLIFTCAIAGVITVTAAVAPTTSAVPVSTTRREMRWQLFLPLDRTPISGAILFPRSQ